MKILYLCDEYPPSQCGGIGIVTRLLAEGMRQRGHRVWVAGIYPDCVKKTETQVQNGIMVIRFKPCAGFLSRTRSRLWFFFFIRKLVVQERIQVIEAPDFLGPCAFWPRLPAPIVVRLHGSATYFSAEQHDPGDKRVFDFELRNLQRADRIVSVSRYASAKTQEYFHFAFPAPVIYNPVDLETQPPNCAPCHGNLVLFVGTLMRKKGVFSLIRAWPQVRASCPDAVLHMVGKDSLDTDGVPISRKLFELLPEGLRHTVLFSGHLDRKDVLQKYAQAKVSVFPSYSETFGMVALEAASAGCPVIFTKRSSGPEILEDGVASLLVDPDDPSGIAAAICAILRDRDLATTLVKNARDTIGKRYSVHTVLDQNEALYSSLIDFE